MSTFDGTKHEIGLNGVGYTLAKNKSNLPYYQKKKQAPFVGKFGSGDSAYRDATFWQYFVQTNWRNGAKQLKYDDPGKFWKSSNVDTTQLDSLKLSKKLTSIGQLAASTDVTCLEAWRNSVSWWDANYTYRQQLIIVAPGTPGDPDAKAVPAGYPIKVTIDTAALETASKVRSDRKDWRVVYWNGSEWVDIVRDYVNTTSTIFPTQATIAVGSTVGNYYVYYGYAAETTDKQADTDAEWNQVYVPEPDASTVLLWHMKEGTGTDIADTYGGINSSSSGGISWGTNGPLGRYVIFDSSSDHISKTDTAALDLTDMTLEAYVYITGGSDYRTIMSKWTQDDDNNSSYRLQIDGNNKVVLGITADAKKCVSDTALTNDTWYHIAATYDGASVAKIYINGKLDKTSSLATAVRDSSAPFKVGNVDDANRGWAGYICHAMVSSVVRTSFPHGLADQPVATATGETTAQPPSSGFELYGGCSDGKIYKWDGTDTWTEQFDTRRLTWYETGNDADELVGDEGGTEKAKSQGFKVSAVFTIKEVEMYLKKNAGTPGDITVRIETDDAGVPSGTLAHANATTTITAFTDTDYAWVTATFADTFTLSAATLYHLVLKTAAAANDQNYAWAADASSPAYTDGAQSYSVDGGANWTADATKDQYFRVKSQAGTVNCAATTMVGGTLKMLFGCGNTDSQANGDAKLFSFDGTTWSLNKAFATATDSCVLSMATFTVGTTDTFFVSVGPQARVYLTTDLSSYTSAKDINTPQNPGYGYVMKEYNFSLFVSGGSPEFLPSQNYNGFFYIYDTVQWRNLYPFDFTVIKACEFYDSYLFLGTYHGQIYVYDTSNLTPLFNFKDQYDWQVSITSAKYFDDKLYFGLTPQTASGDTNYGIWRFDRRGLSMAYSVSGPTKYLCFSVVNNLMVVGTGNEGTVYKVDPDLYVTQGWYQSSYFDANLPSINKLFQSVDIKHDPLVAGQTVNIYYRFKEDDDWTQLTTGATNAVGDITQTLSFASGVYSKKISLKVELNTTNTTTTPNLTEVVLKYSLMPVRKWTWTFKVKMADKIKLLDGEYETSTALALRTALETAKDTDALMTFVDVDGTSYTVLFNDTDEGTFIKTDNDTFENMATVSLLEA